MKKKLLKFFIIIGALGLLLTTLSATQVQGAIQANPNIQNTKKLHYLEWMKPFREMETNGGALGLSEKIHATTLLSTSGSNNLDSHMVKSTEYGAALILSVSGYGNYKKITESTIKTTTGNETGVYMNRNYIEYVAAALSAYGFAGADKRYYDSYGGVYSTAKVGDALGGKDSANPGCTEWKLSEGSRWPEASNHAAYFRRGEFIYYGGDSFGYYSRGVVVCGEGL